MEHKFLDSKYSKFYEKIESKHIFLPLYWIIDHHPFPLFKLIEK